MPRLSSFQTKSTEVMVLNKIRYAVVFPFRKAEKEKNRLERAIQTAPIVDRFIPSVIFLGIRKDEVMLCSVMVIARTTMMLVALILMMENFSLMIRVYRGQHCNIINPRKEKENRETRYVRDVWVRILSWHTTEQGFHSIH